MPRSAPRPRKCGPGLPAETGAQCILEGSGKGFWGTLSSTSNSPKHSSLPSPPLPPDPSTETPPYSPKDNPAVLSASVKVSRHNAIIPLFGYILLQVALQVWFISGSFPVTQLHRMQNYDNNACLQIMNRGFGFLIAEMLYKCKVSLQLKSMTKEIKFPGMFYI